MSRWRRTVLMGDPAHFSVKGGANPHTRTRLGLRRRVDRATAIRQWRGLRDRLRDLGVRVLVVPPDPAQPGLVYPANAGFLTDVDAEKPLSEKTFYLANLLPTREGEKAHYQRVLSAAGFTMGTIDAAYRMEGEADFFPAGDLHLFTYGRIEEQRFVPTLAWPPWRRVYGFRTDQEVCPALEEIVAPRPVLESELLLEAHYHGDTALCAFGPGRRFLLAYRAAIEPSAMGRLREAFGDDLLELSDDDARRYAANAFTLTRDGESFLVLPEGVSDTLLGRIRERGVTPIPVDVSEFLKKGGGSVKCMIGDLGPVREEELGTRSGAAGAGGRGADRNQAIASRNAGSAWPGTEDSRTPRALPLTIPAASDPRAPDEAPAGTAPPRCGSPYPTSQTPGSMGSPAALAPLAFATRSE